MTWPGSVYFLPRLLFLALAIFFWVRTFFLFWLLRLSIFRLVVPFPILFLSSLEGGGV